MAEITLLVGTDRGAFAFHSTDRKTWTKTGPFFPGWQVDELTHVDGSLYAGVAAWSFGAAVRRSDDGGQTWEPCGEIRYAEGSEAKVTRIWRIVSHGGRLYAGVAEAGLFASDDHGATWQEVSGLRAHPTRATLWQPGAGGLMVHHIQGVPGEPQHLYVAISAAGTFETLDGGETWTARNQGVAADFMPNPEAEAGHCVHSLKLAPTEPRTLYQQNHCGMYRSDDGGASWVNISSGLPSRFGFPVVVHPGDPNTVFFIPEGGDDKRWAPDAHLAVWRSRDRGQTYTALREGLPQDAYLGVLRNAFDHDNQEELGLYFGTDNGRIFASANGGDSWTCIAQDLPRIGSVRAVVGRVTA